MAGPLTTEARVRELGQLYDSAALNFTAANLFGLADDAALSTRIATEIAVASAWLSTRGGADYASGDTAKDTLFAEAEAYIALQNLYESLKMRKVLGIHFPYVSENSDRFEALIDVEMPAHIQKFIDAYLAVEEPGKPYALPGMAMTRVIDHLASETLTVDQQLNRIIDEASGTAEPQVPLFVSGREE